MDINDLDIDKFLNPKNSRPDLTELKQVNYTNRVEFILWFTSLEGDTKKKFINAQMGLPVLIEIAEMFFDSMVGTPAESGIPFTIVSAALNNLNDC